MRSGALKATVFGSTSQNDDDQHGHHDRGVDHADIAEPGEQQPGRQRRGGDVGGVVAEQQRAEQPLARCQQPVDDGCASRLPCFSSRIMAARDDAVSAVSLPEKNADSSRQTTNRERRSSQS